MWTHILEDQVFLDEFFATNQTRLAEHYHITTDFLKQHQITFYEGAVTAGYPSQAVDTQLQANLVAQKYQIASETISLPGTSPDRAN